MRLPTSRRLVLVVLFVAVLALAVVQWRRQPSGWAAQQTPYSTQQRALVTVDDRTVCVEVTLTGLLRYERSAGDAGDRHFRNVRAAQPTMAERLAASCSPAAAPVLLSHVHAAQSWATTGGRAVGRRTSTDDGPAASFTQYNSGAPIFTDRLTAKGKVCLVVTPSITVTGHRLSVPLHPVTVCGH